MRSNSYKCNYKYCEKQMNNLNFLFDRKLANELNFKQCHYCLTLYCSKECRKYDWQDHKLNSCYYGHLSSQCKRILSKIGRCYRLRVQLSKISKTGYMSTGKRGFVWLDFSSKHEAGAFLSEPIVLDDQLPTYREGGDLSDFLFYFGNNLLPKYVCFENISKELLTNDIKENSKSSGESELVERNDVILKRLFNINESNFELNEYNEFKKICLNYDPKIEFILLISVQTNANDIQKDLKPNTYKYTYNKYVAKYMKFRCIDASYKLKLQPAANESSQIIEHVTPRGGEISAPTPTIDSAETAATLILTSLCNADESAEEKRQLFMVNLLTEFEERGIEIRTMFPKLYRDLCSYVEQNRPFTPICLFPRDLNKNNLFMCLILPNSEPSNHTWLYESKDDLEKSLNLSNYLYIA